MHSINLYLFFVLFNQFRLFVWMRDRLFTTGHNCFNFCWFWFVLCYGILSSFSSASRAISIVCRLSFSNNFLNFIHFVKLACTFRKRIQNSFCDIFYQRNICWWKFRYGLLKIFSYQITFSHFVESRSWVFLLGV